MKIIQYEYLTLLLSFVVIFLWMSTSTLPILAFDPIQDLGVDNGGPRLTIINNTTMSLQIDGVRFMESNDTYYYKEDFPSFEVQSNDSVTKPSQYGDTYFWGRAGTSSGGFDVTIQGRNSKEDSITLPTKTGFFYPDHACRDLSSDICDCIRIDWKVNFNKDKKGWVITFTEINEPRGCLIKTVKE